MASSPQRTAANRENARSSTGPRSGQGKARASLDQAAMPTMIDFEKQFAIPKLARAASAGQSMPVAAVAPVSPEPSAPGHSFRYTLPFTASPGPEQPASNAAAFEGSPLDVLHMEAAK